MPSQHDRLQMEPESLQHFELAAGLRLAEAAELLTRGHSAGACYLAGYVVEMSLKFAFFKLEGVRLGDPVKPRLATVRARGRLLFPRVRDDAYHSVLFWACMVGDLRTSNGLGWPDEAVSRARRVHDLWSVDLRYRSDVTSAKDAVVMVQEAGWFRARAPALWR